MHVEKKRFVTGPIGEQPTGNEEASWAGVCSFSLGLGCFALVDTLTTLVQNQTCPRLALKFPRFFFVPAAAKADGILSMMPSSQNIHSAAGNEACASRSCSLVSGS